MSACKNTDGLYGVDFFPVGTVLFLNRGNKESSAEKESANKKEVCLLLHINLLKITLGNAT